MFIDPELILKVIETQNLTRIVVYDIDRQNKLDYFTGDPSAVGDRFTSTLNVMSGAFRVECGTKDDEVAVGGRKSEKRAPFVWKVLGRKGQGEPAAPGGPSPATELPHGQLQMALQLQQLQFNLELEKQKREQLEAMLDEEDDDEDDSSDRPMSQREMFDTVRELLRELKGGPSPKMLATNGTQAPMAGTGGEILDPEFKQALEHWKRSNPDDYNAQFGSVREMVMKSYREANGGQ